jgi:hypothetical protein
MGTVRISSQNGLVTPGIIGLKRITGDNNTRLKQWVRSDQDSFIITGTSQEIYLYPSYRAGKDLIQVTIGDKVWSIPLVVKA